MVEAEQFAGFPRAAHPERWVHHVWGTDVTPDVVQLHQSQHSLQAQLSHTEPLHMLTHDPAVSQHISTGLDSFPRCLALKLCRHILCKAQDSHLSSGFSAPAP